MDLNRQQPSEKKGDAKARRTAQVRAYLAGLTGVELIAYILKLARRSRSVRRDLVTRTLRAALSAQIKRAERDQDWVLLAELRSEAFVASPSVGSLLRLQQAAEKVGCGTQVRRAALSFLETGKPAGLPSSHGAKHLVPRSRKHGKDPRPRYDLLLELALKEHRAEDALRWYDALTRVQADEAAAFCGFVADAVAAVHPDRALELYGQLIVAHAAHPEPGGCDAALPYLRKVRGLLYQHGRAAEWTVYLAQLSDVYRRQPRFLELLDLVEGRRGERT